MDNKICSPLPLAGFLFGNIDESGQLDTDLFDNDTKKYLGSLTRLGFDSFVDEIIGNEHIISENISERKSSVSGSDSDDCGDLQSKSFVDEVGKCFFCPSSDNHPSTPIVIKH